MKKIKKTKKIGKEARNVETKKSPRRKISRKY